LQPTLVKTMIAAKATQQIHSPNWTDWTRVEATHSFPEVQIHTGRGYMQVSKQVISEWNCAVLAFSKPDTVKFKIYIFIVLYCIQVFM